MQYDEIIQKTRKAIIKGRLDDYGVVNTRNEEVLSVRTSKNQIPRVLRILKMILKEATKRGYEVGLNHERWSKRHDTYIEISGHKIEFFLQEAVKRRDHVPTVEEKRDHFFIHKYDFFPTGDLTLIIETWGYGFDKVQKKFSSNRTGELEDKIGKFFKSLEQIAANKERKRIEDIEHERLQEIEQQKRAEEEKVRQEKLAKIKDLEDAAERYDKAQKVRTYVEYLANKSQLSGAEKERIEISKIYLTQVTDEI